MLKTQLEAFISVKPQLIKSHDLQVAYSASIFTADSQSCPDLKDFFRSMLFSGLDYSQIYNKGN